MSTSWQLDPRSFTCAAHRVHSPVPWVLEGHHVVPESWTKALQMPSSRIAVLCPVAHDAVHRIISAWIRDMPVVRPIPAAYRMLAKEAFSFWEAHPELAQRGHLIEELRGLALP